MKRLIIKANDSDNWIGGLYYKANVIFMLTKNSWFSQNVQLVVDCNEYSYNFFMKLFFGFESNIIFRKRRTLLSILDNLKFNRTECVFPSNNILGTVKNIAWIPDFQHNYYKEYFPFYVRLYRSLKYYWIALMGMPLILSSEDCLCDFKKFYKKNLSKVYVLHFISYIEPLINTFNENLIMEILIKYGLNNRKYICIMNQFWKHKNHITVFKAIAQYVNNNPETDFLFVFTGKMEDYRNPTYISELKTIIHNNNIEKFIKMLGFINRIEQLIVMHKAEYIIQPSLFEGWGTVLEDAKVLDKTVLLSDISVHREQKHDKAILFEPENFVQLADIISDENQKQHFDDVAKGILNMHERAVQYSVAFETLLKEIM